MRTILAALTLAVCALLATAAPAFAATFDALDVIPYDTFHASSSMTEAQIQTFLEARSGPLKSVVTTDYAGVPNKTAARIIWEAARDQTLNPKVILATLQKEQSLLTVSNSANAARLVKAMGCGVYGAVDPLTGLTTNRFPGFGSQVWNAARLLSNYEVSYDWFPGKTKTVTVSANGATLVIVPKNASTFALYTYTPYYPQRLVWDIYVQYFGDPHTAVVVPKTPTTLALSISKSSAELGEGYVLSGAIDPAFVGAPIIVSYRRPGETTWRSWTTLATTADGTFSVGTRGYRLGTYRYRATFPGDATHAVARYVYDTITMTAPPVVKTPTTLTMSISKDHAGLSEGYVLSGAIGPAFAGAPIVVSYRRPGETTWRSWTTLTTGAAGRFSVGTRGYRPGTYQYRATFPGDATHAVARYVYDTIHIVR
ncbi:MAG TPA: hypothetical protein VIK31_09695 [Propionibacteriaceae bacterium]